VEEVNKLWEGFTEDGKTRDIAVEVAGGLGDTTRYLKPSVEAFPPDARDAFLRIRKMFPCDSKPGERGVSDLASTMLVLLGGIGSHTPFHLDWTQALNVAYAVGCASNDEVLSEWVFINPSAIPVADAWLRSQSRGRGRPFANGFSSEGGVCLRGSTLERFIGSLTKLHRDNVVVCRQRHGEMVVVPPGWIHQVTNLKPNIKLAWDTIDHRQFAAYALLHTSIATKYFRGVMAEDYMAVNRVIEIELLKV
jgi:hypothetical protein